MRETDFPTAMKVAMKCRQDSRTSIVATFAGRASIFPELIFHFFISAGILQRKIFRRQIRTLLPFSARGRAPNWAFLTMTFVHY
jgi:hypothetical protein